MKNNSILKIPEIPKGQVLINETFCSLQGEGYYSGKAAFFIRFAGCDIGCIWCDSKDTWSVENSRFTEIKEIVKEVKKYKTDIIVITGGEPLIYDLKELTDALKKTSKEIHVETSGAYPLSVDFDWLTVSPKKNMKIIESTCYHADELKIVVFESSDIEFAKSLEDKVKRNCKLFLQPEWGNQKNILPEIIDFIKNNPQWQLSLQTHKYIDIP
ncbi:MAG: 7-carboxy-7-deazaguanine synthase QueE [Bacteroidota bacterium]|nr:7-carboxy-7-deazaguanine synthase QueE [Bacteroidota bacterium]